MSMENLQNEHKAIAALLDSNDDLWRPLSLAALLSATALPMALFVTMALWWFELITHFWWWFVAIGFGSLAAVWSVYWLISYAIGIGMLGVKLSGAKAATAYNNSLRRLADGDMNRPIFVEPDNDDIEDVEVEVMEPPILINGPQGTQFLPRDDSPGANILGAFNRPQLAAVSTMEHSVPNGLSRRQQLEQQYGIKPALAPSSRQPAKATVKPRRKMMTVADGVAVDIRDLAYFIRNAFTVGTKAAEWRTRFNQQRYTHEIEGKAVQKHVFEFFANRGVLVKAGNGWELSPDYANSDEILSHLGLLV